MQGVFDSLKAEVAKSKAERVAFVKQYNLLAKKWNAKNPKSKVALIK
jgi:hypothetical protein